ncbi:MAG: BREX system P-loop protein BrxC [Firmicutes bacterium]|nr:BREX system P-loop protein BrxC [Bacillota bacterium]
MKIKDLFQKDIKRNINGVIQAGQLDEESIYMELDEYVVTDELIGNLDTFYGHYIDGLSQPTSKMGVWISGFFGSGKSHLLKILSYLISNRTVKGKEAVDFFRDKDINPELLRMINAAAAISSDALLFNIDSKSATGAKNEKQKIVDVFLKVFNEHLGYSGMAWIAEIERNLEREGQYQKFKDAFAKSGRAWEESRDYILIKQKDFIKAMQTIGYDEEVARTFLKGMKDSFEITSESLAKLIAQYCRGRGKDYRLIFLVDEIGQYIGDNRELMLNLQTVVEDLGNYAQGQVWVIVTSQEKIDAVTKVRGEDFSKIQGRFSTRLNLSSANTDEVIKRRLLDKKQVAQESLCLDYEAREQSLRNMLSFDSSTGALRSGFRSSGDFVASYPFVPYQFELLQRVFDKIRVQGEAGKHLSRGERSLLNAFQEVAVFLDEDKVGRLASFAHFYETLESFLDTPVKSTIHKAKNRDGIEPFDLDVLKTLYMIKGIDGFPASPENITTLLVDHLDAIKNEIERRVTRSLDKLIRHVLIQHNADHTYSFLSDEEQEINQEIKKTPLDNSKVLQDMTKVFFNDIYPQTRYRYPGGRDFEFNRRFDSHTLGVAQHALTLQVYAESITDMEARLRSTNGVLVVRLPEDGPGFSDPFEYAVKIATFLNRRSSANLTRNQERIIDQKRGEISDFEVLGRDALKEACSRATFYVEGQSYTFSGEPGAQIDRAFEILVRNTFTKLHYIDYKLEVKNAAQQIKEWALNGIQQRIDGTLPNQLAQEEVQHYLEEQQEKYVRSTMKALVDHFTGVPYGWMDWDIAGVTTLLLREGKIKLSYLGERFNNTSHDYIQRLTRAAEREKVVVELEVAITPEVRRRLGSIMRKYFGQQSIGDTYEEVAKVIRGQAGEKMQKPLREIQQRRRQEFQDFPYPGSTDIMRLEGTVDDLLSRKEDEQLVSGLLDLEDQLEEWFEQLDDLKSFYLGKAIEHFDGAVKVLQQRKTDLQSSLDNIKLQTIKREIETILRNEDPYRLISRLPELLHRLNEGLQKVLNQAREKYLPDLENIQAAVAEMAAHYNADPEIELILKKGQDSIGQQICQFQETDSITHLIAVPTLVKNAADQIKSQVQYVLQKRKPKPPTGGGTPIKAKKLLSGADLLSLALSDPVLEISSENELDRVIGDLREKLLQLMEENILVLRK